MVVALTACAIAGTRPAAAQAKSTVLFDFEDEKQVAEFVTSDAARAADPDARPLVYVFPSSIVPPEVGGKHSLHAMFRDGADSWARIVAAVDGAEWSRSGATALGLFVSSYDPKASVDLVLETQDRVRYVHTVTPPSEGWSRLTIPFEEFRGETGTASDALRDIRFMAIEKRGAWSGCVLRFDQFELLAGTVAPPTGPGPGGTTPPVGPGPVSPPTADRLSVKVSAALTPPPDPVQFRTYLGGNIGPSDLPLLRDANTAALVKALEPVIRTVVTIPDKESDDASVLRELDSRVQALQAVAKPNGVLICVGAPVDGTVSSARYAQFCTALVKRYNQGARAQSNGIIRYWELLSDPELLTDDDYRRACDMFNKASKAMRGVDPQAGIAVGGVSFFAAQRGPLDRVLRGTKTLLSFLSWRFCGATAVSANDRQLFAAADSGVTYGIPDAIGSTDALELLKVADLYDSGLLFVTECSLSTARSANGSCQDHRAASSFAASWLASYLTAAGPVVDVVLVSNLFGNSWGAIRPDGTAGPMYWTMRLFHDLVPRKSVITKATSTGGDDLFALGALDGDRKMLLLVNRSAKEADVTATCQGIRRGETARFVTVGGAVDGIVEATPATELPEAPSRSLEAGRPPSAGAAVSVTVSGLILPPHAVGVLEFRPGR